MRGNLFQRLFFVKDRVRPKPSGAKLTSECDWIAGGRGARWDEYRENAPSNEYMCSILSKVLRQKRPTERPRMESKPPSPPTAARAFPCCLRRIAIRSGRFQLERRAS